MNKAVSIVVILFAAACSQDFASKRADNAGDGAGSGAGGPASLASIQNVVVIYAENHGFDHLYGAFPGANGIPTDGSIMPQLDRDGSTLPNLPQTWGGVTSPGFSPVITQAQSDGLANAPYELNTTYPGFDDTYIPRDMYHRFYENQMQIDGGANDMFAAFADSGGLVLGHYDGSQMAMWQLAQQYTLADNFFMGAFGGSFLNHQYLICACAPEYANADTAAAQPSISIVDTDSNGNFTANLTAGSDSPASALDGAPTFALSGNLTPNNYFGDSTFHAVNTMEPPYQPSGNAPSSDDADHLYADPNNATTLPAQTATTIGDELTAAEISWSWYSGAWDETLATAIGNRMFPPSSAPGAAPNFQFHHQPFNYFAAFDPVMNADARSEHLKDYTDLEADIAAGTLPSVVFYKPEGDLNQHNGYASVGAGDEHIAQLVAQLQASPQYANMVIIVTYDENGGTWDHVSPPTGDMVGPGNRIPAIIISPYAKRGYVDHTQYDTGSILRLLNTRFGLAPLAGTTARDQALAASGAPAMGDLTNALSF